VAGAYVWGNEPSGSIKCGNFVTEDLLASQKKKKKKKEEEEEEERKEKEKKKQTLLHEVSKLVGRLVRNSMFTVIAPVCQILFHTAKITKHAENKFQ
jgi:hypothetical protein